MAESTFREVLDFLGELGIYDVVLPFLLVFAIVFAIFEKTKILGTEKIEGHEYTKKNLNAIIAFVISFFVVASSKLVGVINQALSNIVLLLMLIVFFLLLVGVFFKEGEDVILEGGWKTFFMFTTFMGIVLIFLDALDWLSPFWDWLSNNASTRWLGSLFLLAIIIGFMYFITKTPGSKPKKEGK